MGYLSETMDTKLISLTEYAYKSQWKVDFLYNIPNTDLCQSSIFLSWYVTELRNLMTRNIKHSRLTE